MINSHIIFTLAATLSLPSFTTAPAGQWLQSGTEWKYQADGASFHAGGLQWIDSNGTMVTGFQDIGGDSSWPLYSNDFSSNSESSYARDVFQLVNRERTENGINPLEWDDALAICAQQRAHEIEKTFNHTRPDGSSSFTILEEGGISYTSWGENIASGQKTPAAAVTAWMNSSSHRESILKSSFGRTGVGYAYINGTCYWVQLFTN